jgi:hypothetical protein
MDRFEKLNMKIICLTGFSLEEEQKAKLLIEELRGIYSSNLTIECFCLIVRTVGSNKYVAGLQSHIHLLTPQWLYDCREKHLKISDFCSTQILERYKVKAFTGLSFSITGIVMNSKSKLCLASF